MTSTSATPSPRKNAAPKASPRGWVEPMKPFPATYGELAAHYLPDITCLATSDATTALPHSSELGGRLIQYGLWDSTLQDDVISRFSSWIQRKNLSATPVPPAVKALWQLVNCHIASVPYNDEEWVSILLNHLLGIVSVLMMPPNGKPDADLPEQFVSTTPSPLRDGVQGDRTAILIFLQEDRRMQHMAGLPIELKTERVLVKQLMASKSFIDITPSSSGKGKYIGEKAMFAKVCVHILGAAAK